MDNQQQRGAALIMALLLVAIVTVIATTLLFTQTIDIQRTVLQNVSDQARLDNNYVLLWWQNQWQQLNIALSKQQQLPRWPQQLSTRLNNDDIITAQITSASAKFNINNLALPVSPYLSVFTNLIQIVEPKINSAAAQQIALNVQNWLMNQPDTLSLSNYYARLSPPYQAAHQPMASISELRLVAGISAELYQALLPYVAALPDLNVPIDVNSAAKPVLMALLNRDASAAEAVIRYRNMNSGFLSDAMFLGLPAVQSYLAQADPQTSSNFANLISTKMPTYFFVHSEIKHDKMHFQYDSLIEMLTQGNQLVRLQQGPSL